MGTVADARAAHHEHDWPRAYELLRQAAPDELDADDLSAMADAAWWLGKMDESVAVRERAYDARVAADDHLGAAFEAFSLSLALGDKGADALASGWRARAHRLAQNDPGSLTSGYLLSMEATAAFHAGDADECVEKARRTIEIGRKNGDPTLVAWGTHVEGLGLVKRGDIDEGWTRLDESMVAVTRDRLKPLWVGLMHCGMLVACEEFGDPRRGWQWVEETERWLGTVPGAVLYPGVCRVHKVRIMQLRGTWTEAEAEARRVCADLMAVHTFTVARAYYEIAEIKRLSGEYDAALEFYGQASNLGIEVQPGLARLRLAQGRVDAARAGLRRALGETHDPLLRAALLPHQIDVALAAGDLEDATAAADELDALASSYRSPMVSGSADTGCATVQLARGDAQAALPRLRRALDTWRHLDCLYDAARTRSLIAQALDLLGDEDGAQFEREATAQLFDRLGAKPDADRERGAAAGAKEMHGLTVRELDVLRHVVTGRSNKEIAAKLVISENTVARHLQNIFAKLGVPSRSAAASWAVKQGLS